MAKSLLMKRYGFNTRDWTKSKRSVSPKYTTSVYGGCQGTVRAVRTGRVTWTVNDWRSNVAFGSTKTVASAKKLAAKHMRTCIRELNL